MENPYKPPEAAPTPVRSQRAVRRYFVVFLSLTGLGTVVAIPGIVLLNQHYRWVDVDFTIYHVDVYGTSISIEGTLCGSVALALTAWLFALLAARIWILNRRFNRTHFASKCGYVSPGSDFA